MDDATAKLRRNEGRKLRATFLNNVGVAFFVAAILQPILLFLQQGEFGAGSVVFSVGSLLVSGGSVYLAHRLINGLEA